jgi:hypothetical protein
VGFSLGVPVQPYQAHVLRTASPFVSAGSLNVRRPWNRNYPGWEPVLWPVPQEVSANQSLGPLELGVHASWLMAGGSLRTWIQTPAPDTFATALVIDGQHGYQTDAWEVRGLLELHRLFAARSLRLGVGASTGSRRHDVSVPVSFPSIGDDGNDGSGRQLSRYVLRPETRVEGMIGGTVLRLHAGQIGVTVTPYWVAHARAFRDSRTDQYSIDSFANQYGATVWVDLHVDLGYHAP